MGGKLGRMVVSDAGSRLAGRRRLWIGVTVVVVLIAIIATSVAAYWLALPPKKILIRGSSLLAGPELLARMDIDETDTGWTIWAKARAFDGEGTRWISAARYQPLAGRGALLEITESKPLLPVVSGEQRFWLCQDGWLKPVDEVADQDGVFERINKLPTVMLDSAVADSQLAGFDHILETAAACYAALPGEIAQIEREASGELVLYDKSGFPVRLGKPTDIHAKISALPKALRICNENREQLLYLDASNPDVFYEKWKEPQVSSDT